MCFLFLLERRTTNITASANRATTASPPTTPPTIVPTGTGFDFEAEGVEKEVGSVLSALPLVAVGALSPMVVGRSSLPVREGATAVKDESATELEPG